MVIRIPNWLGDALMATPIYKNLSVEDSLMLFGPPSFLKLFEDFPRVSLLPFYKKEKKINLKNLKKFKQERALLLTNSFSSAWLFFRAGFREIMGYSTDLRGFLLTKKVKPPQVKMHQREKYLYLIEKLGFTVKEKELTLPLKKEKILKAERFLWEKKIELGKNPLILIAPGAAYGPAKKWPEDYYKKLAEKLTKEGFRVLIVGSMAEKETGHYIMKDLQGVYNLCGETEITLLAGIFLLSNILISNDSGLMHLAAALKIPQIAIFGSTDPTLTGPLNPKARVLQTTLSCSPCFKRICPKGNYQCLREITVEEVYKKIKSFSSEVFEPKNSFHNEF